MYGQFSEFFVTYFALTHTLHLSAWLLGNYQVCMDSIRQCAPHLHLGL